MDLINFLVLLSFLTNLILALIVHFRSEKSKANTFFELAIYAICGWCLSMFLYRSASPDKVIFWARMLYFFPTFIPTLFLLFGLHFPNTKVKITPVVLIIIVNLIMALLTLTPGAVIHGVIELENEETTLVFGWAYYRLYLIYVPYFFITSYYFLFRKYKNGDPFLRAQIRFILFGLIFASNIAMVVNLVMPTFNHFELNWFGQTITFVWVGFVSYAIIKHRLMSIRLIVARLVTYIMLLSTLGILYISLIFILSDFFFPKAFSQNYLIFTSLLALFASLSFQSLRKLFEKITDKIFFKNQYKTDDLLEIASKVISSTINLEILTRNILKLFIEKIRISKAAFIILKKDSISVVSSDKDGFTFSQEELEQLKSKDNIVILEEVKDEKTKQLLSSHEISIFLPLKTEEKLVGFLLLADKLSGETYFEEDIKVFEILGPQIAIAIQNAQAYEEIEQFSITLKKEVEKATKELKSANFRLKELSLLKDEFVSIASHELRTPMTTIKSYLWLVLNKAKNLDEKVKRDLQIAYESTERTIILVKDMLTVSRIEGNRLDINFSAFDLKELASQVVGELKIKAGERNIKLAIRPFSEDLVINGDRDKIGEVFQNIIGNALKFTPERGNVEVYFQKKNKMVEVSVSDDGSGISKKDISKLFQKFSRLGNSLSKMAETPGTGLGLYIAKQIVGLHKGKIWVESIVGKGSTFTFSLPLGERTYVGRK